MCNADYKGATREHISEGLRMACRYINELENVGTAQIFWDLVYYSLVVSKTMRLAGTVQTLPNLRSLKLCSFRLTHFNKGKNTIKKFKPPNFCVRE